MPVNEAVIKELIEVNEKASVLSLKHDGQPGMPVSPDDDLADLPEHLKPQDEMWKLVRTAVGFTESDQYDGENAFFPVVGLYEDSKDCPDGKQYDPHYRRGSWSCPSSHGLNYREMVTQLLQKHPATHPSCTRATLTVFRGSTDFRLVVHNIDVYVGDDLAVARGLVAALRKLHVTNDGVQRALSSYEMEKVGIFRYRCHDFQYAPYRAKPAARTKVDRRIAKGQLPPYRVKYMFDSMTNAMSTAAREHGMLVYNTYISERNFAGYAARVKLAYPLFVTLVCRKNRSLFHTQLLEMRPYLPGMLKSEAYGRADFARWVRKTIRKELK